MVSIKDIASACGVSASTVSKALNNHSDISGSTKELIRRKAAELGYRPNASAQTLKTNRSKNLGVLFVDEAMNGLTHDFFARVLDSFKVTAEKYGYDITFIISHRHGEDGMSYLEHSRYRRFDGVVIACVKFDAPEVQELIGSEIPIVTIDYHANERIAVLSNNLKGMSMLTQYAVDMGHRRIAYIYGEASLPTTNRLSGFYITMENNKIPVNDDYVREIRYRNMEEAARATRELMALPAPPTCILYPDDYSCFGGINALRNMGLGIPEDVSVAGYDGIPMAIQFEPKLTTVIQDTVTIGRCAAEKLIGVIEHPRLTAIESVIVDSELYQGESIARIG